MKKVLLLFFLSQVAISVSAQVKFLDRFEVASQPFEPIFEIMRIPEGLVSFRTFQAKSFNSDRIFQYYTTGLDLKSTGLIEVKLRNGFDMIGYDTDQHHLYVLLSKGFNTGAEKYILHINLQTNEGFEYPAENLLPLDLVEFLVINRKAVFMGNAEGRPVLQIYNIDDKSVHTVQGVYGNNTQVLQIRKLAELEALEVVVSRRGQYKVRETSILTFDMLGNLVREVKVDQFGQQGQEILEGLLLADQNYQQVMIGSYGLVGRNSYQGMYIMEINEFGEYEFKLYTLEDFPNFFNYLPEKRKAKQDQIVVSDLEKGKIPSIRNTYSIRDVRETEDAYYVYFDQLNIVTSRGSGRGIPNSSTNPYRYDRMSRMGYAPYYMDPFVSPNMPIHSFSLYTEYQYQSAHFVKVAKTGQVIWDNAATYREFITNYPEPFGEIAVVGDDLFHLYAVDDQIRLSFFRNGEKIVEDHRVDFALPDENGRIQSTDFESVRLVHWYDRYFLLSGKQTVRYMNSQNQEEFRDVFFMSKILVDGDLYQPVESRD
ncbi:transcriptional regulator [Algoriphagus sp. AK58]|uniref:transcriptional regulator n=1 Tax=Algoriphagus sp. AK58 TaxID=1406877 RepID=UPI00164F0D99|nr:transcriptional regulator [Algoriphagus sp. AK58]MBC6366783.1 transcriptional regulator [Algoriphagus sp. AK58]